MCGVLSWLSHTQRDRGTLQESMNLCPCLGASSHPRTAPRTHPYFDNGRCFLTGPNDGARCQCMGREQSATAAGIRFTGFPSPPIYRPICTYPFTEFHTMASFFPLLCLVLPDGRWLYPLAAAAMPSPNTGCERPSPDSTRDGLALSNGRHRTQRQRNGVNYGTVGSLCSKLVINTTKIGFYFGNNRHFYYLIIKHSAWYFKKRFVYT